MSKAYLTSDLHLFHRMVQHLRGYASDDEQIEALRASWSRVTKRDTVYVLGDVCLARLPATFDILNSLPGTKHLILGNHDGAFPSNHRASTAQRRYFEAFASVSLFTTARIAGHDMMLSHFPYDGEGGRNLPERYGQYRPRDLGVPLIHGHVHRQFQFSRSALGTPQIHIGLDAFPNLASDAEVIEVLNAHTNNSDRED